MRSIKEALAGILVALVVLGVPVGAYIGDRVSKDQDMIDIHIRTHENGGFEPKKIVVKQGETVRLRLLSEDVSHGFIIGELGIDAGKIEPGKPVVVEFKPDKLGEIGFVCSIVCSPSHTKLRGTLVVE